MTPTVAEIREMLQRWADYDDDVARSQDGASCGCDNCRDTNLLLARLDPDGVVIDGSMWPWPGDTRLPWQVWNEVPHPDGMTVYDPDGFRFGRPTVVTWDEFERARGACTMAAGRGGHEVPR
jgi:hypothetical protein